MIIIVCVILSIVSMYIAAKTDHTNDIISGTCTVIGIVGIILSIIMLFIFIQNHIPTMKNKDYVQYEQRYEAITMALESNPNNVILLTTEISDYNSEILSGRFMQDSIWFSPLDYDFYYDLPLIEFETEND